MDRVTYANINNASKDKVHKSYLVRSYFHVESTCDAAEPVHGSTYCEDIVGNTRICSVECDANYRRAGSHMYMCNRTTGTWSPALKEVNKFPACINGEER